MTFHLDAFEGPLDLLLHLISKNKVSIYDIPIAEICEQYMEVLEDARGWIWRLPGILSRWRHS